MSAFKSFRAVTAFRAAKASAKKYGLGMSDQKLAEAVSESEFEGKVTPEQVLKWVRGQ